MGLFDRFKKKQESEKIEEAIENVKISELAQWLVDNLNLEILQKKSKDFYEDIIVSFNQLIDLNEILSKAEFEIKDKSYVAVNMTKDGFVKKANSVINSINFSKTIDQSKIFYEFMDDFHSSVNKSLKEIQSLTPKQAILISRYFRKDAAPVMEKLKDIEKTIKNLSEFLKNEGKGMKIIDNMKQKTNEYHDLINALDSLEKKKTEKTLNAEKIEKSEIETKISNFKKNPEWIEFEALRKELKSDEEKASDIEYNIKEQLSAVSKPLKKMEYVLEREIINSDFPTSLLKDFLYKPLESFIAEDGDASLNKLIENLNKMIGDKKIVIKSKEIQKIKELKKAANMQLKELRSIYRDIKNKNKERENKINKYADLVEKISELNKHLEAEREESQNLKQELVEISKKISEIKDNITNIKNEIESTLLNEIGKKIELVMN